MKELIDEILPYFQHVNTKKGVAICCGIFVFGILFGYLIFPLTLKALIANVSINIRNKSFSKANQQRNLLLLKFYSSILTANAIFFIL